MTILIKNQKKETLAMSSKKTTESEKGREKAQLNCASSRMSLKMCPIGANKKSLRCPRPQDCPNLKSTNGGGIKRKKLPSMKRSIKAN